MLVMMKSGTQDNNKKNLNSIFLRFSSKSITKSSKFQVCGNPGLKVASRPPSITEVELVLSSLAGVGE